MLQLSDYDYQLPEELIAKYPLAHRSDSRLLILHHKNGTIEDRSFPEIQQYVHPGDCIVLNETRVIPARLMATRETTGAIVEIFLETRQADMTDTWRVLAAPAKKLKSGERYIINNDLSCIVLEELPEGERIVRFESESGHLETALESAGSMPIPPYLHRPAEMLDRERYQTVYAHSPGAVAAPTAGLHFTSEILSVLENKGVRIVKVTLHVGLGTFRPVESEDITKHTMHAERYEVSKEAASIINNVRKNGGKIVAVGTTAARTLETVANSDGIINTGSGETSIFIYPPYKFKAVDALLTNFHQPKSTLLMMISAFSGYENVMKAYKHVIKERYRFLSYGDAMLIIE
ncbi:MAG TPA: tRNA preQ1(34) S-adenosylmethionine ribosyltransferase-isomerase QueA [Candidatus Kapabacteria bacterium]|nr:tRNA preQ1(34) S-adenosylmethionine ribosyltransferase-isomerase QueA [Candidatus Kapabacteria bacterium]